MRFVGALILNKIIEDLKSKLPFLKKKEEEIDAQSEEKTGLTEITDLNSVEDDSLDEDKTQEDKSILSKLKATIASLQKKKKPSSEDDEEFEEEDEDSEEDEEEEKKKKRSKIIRIAIVGALVLFLVSDYILPPEEEPVPENTEVVESPARKNKKKVEEAPAPTEETPAPATPAEETPIEEAPVEEAPVETPTEQPDTAVDELPDVSAENPTTPPEEAPAPTESIPAPEDIPSDDSSSTTYTPEDSPVDITSNDETGSESSSHDSVFGEDSTVGDISAPDPEGSTSSDDFTDQILQDLEKQAKPTEEKKTITSYVAPPDYEYQGRGLVYNCRGKHWACVDAPSYKICEDNAASVKHLGKSTECYPFNVYETTRGCEITQNRMVSSSAKTNFCDD